MPNRIFFDGDPVPGSVPVKVGVDRCTGEIVITLGAVAEGVIMVLSARDARQLGEGIMAGVEWAETVWPKGKA